MTTSPLTIRMHAADNVAIVANDGGLPAGTAMPDGLTLGETTCKWWREQSYYDEGGWKGTQALDGGGALMNQAIHSVDLLLWMMGDATHVTGFTAMLAHERIEVEDTAVAVLRFKSGALGVIQATTSVHPGYPKTIGIHGDQGSAVIEQDVFGGFGVINAARRAHRQGRDRVGRARAGVV